MKRITALLLGALLLLGAAGCGAKPEQAVSVFGADGDVLLARDGVTVTTAGWTTDTTSTDAPALIALHIENTSGKEICLGIRHGVVNGFQNDLNLIEFYQENGELYGGNYAFELTLPAEIGESSVYALGFNKATLDRAGIETVTDIEFSLTLAADETTAPYYTSPRLCIRDGETGEVPEPEGTVAIDDERVKIVFCAQDYDDYFGPTVDIYVRNKTDKPLGVAVESAEADGAACDDVYYGVSLLPGARDISTMSFDGPARALKGIESLSIRFRLREAKTMDGLNSISGGTLLDPVTVRYPPQVWGEYENGGVRFSVTPRYNELLTVETPQNSESGILFAVSETASLEAGGYDGAGWLFSIGTVDAARLHELLCADMSGAYVFAKDAAGSYYLYYHPTDVRYARADADALTRDQAQWTKLTAWADGVTDTLLAQNETLEGISRGNSTIEQYLARAAYDKETRYTLSGTEFGVISSADFDAAPYVEELLGAHYFQLESGQGEAPAGEYIVLSFPADDVRFDFFFSGEDSIVREVSGGRESFYETYLYDEAGTSIGTTNVMQRWYRALAAHTGVKTVV